MICMLSMDRFDSEYKGNPVILIGAGKRTQRILDNYNWKLKFAIDNNPDKRKKLESKTGKTLNVYDWDYLKKNYNKGDIVIVTPQIGYQEIIKKIEKDFGKVNIYVMAYMMALQWDANRIKESARPFEFTKGSVNRIPKKIHYFWFSGDPYPEKVKKCIDSWHKYCPDYEFKLWNLDNYQTNNVFFNEAISKESWSIASDYSRCDVIFREGGLYLDVDVELIKPLDDLLYDEGFFSFESSFGVDPGSGMGCVAGNRIFGEILKQYDGLRYIGDDGELQYENISLQYTKVLERFGLVRNGEYQNINNIAVYPPLVLNPYSYTTGIDSRYEKTYAVHHWASSWIPDEDREEMEERKRIISTYVNERGGIMNFI